MVAFNCITLALPLQPEKTAFVQACIVRGKAFCLAVAPHSRADVSNDELRGLSELNIMQANLPIARPTHVHKCRFTPLIGLIYLENSRPTSDT